METTKLQKKISRKECESRRHSDRIPQRQSNQKCNSENHNEDDATNNNDKEHTLSKSHCKPRIPTPKSKRQEMNMPVRLPSLLLKLAIELVSQIEKWPLLTDLGPQMTPPKILIVVKIRREKSKILQELIKLDTNTDSSMLYLFGLQLDGRKYMTMKNVQNAAGHSHR